MLPEKLITPRLKRDDYLPVDVRDEAALLDAFEFSNQVDVGTELRTRKLPPPTVLAGVPTVFTHVDGVDWRDRLDPSVTDAITDERTITLEGLVLMRRQDQPHRFPVVAATFHDNGWRSQGLQIKRFNSLDGIPVIGIDEHKQRLVVVSGGRAITRAVAHLFPKST